MPFNLHRVAEGRGSKEYGYGSVFREGKFRTIMAYNYRGEKRINCYSSPNVTYSVSHWSSLTAGALYVWAEGCQHYNHIDAQCGFVNFEFFILQFIKRHL